MFPILVFPNDQEFFDVLVDQYKEGAAWHYVGQQPVDLAANPLSDQLESGEPYILFKLNKENKVQVVDLGLN